MYTSSKRLKNKRLLFGLLSGFIVSAVLVFFVQFVRQLANNIYINILIVILCTTSGFAIGFIRHLLAKPVDDESIIRLHRENLTITKRNVQTGDVSVRKEVIHDTKNITVPVTREELVIENRRTDPSNGKKASETIRIPFREERIIVEKKAVQLEDVSMFRKQLINYKRIHETLKEEKADIKVSGNVQKENSEDI